MQVSKKIRREIFKNAWAFFKETGATFSECLKTAWAKAKQTADLISQERAEKIARNINAFDIYFEYIDDGKKWAFWHDLKRKLFDILKALSGGAKEQIKALCKPNQAQYFGL